VAVFSFRGPPNSLSVVIWREALAASPVAAEPGERAERGEQRPLQGNGRAG
jgi:hypothetical protein